MLDTWNFLRFFETEPTARDFLTSSYACAGIEHPERQAFQQCTRFVYTWKQARTYYESAVDADLLIQPLLLFYGCMQMIKGCILAIDPSYPHNSRMLQHGVTTRKMKKSPYRLLEDEVRPQKEGLFAHAARLFQVSPLCERYKMGYLFASLADLASVYERIVGAGSWVPVVCQEHGSRLIFPAQTSGDGPLSYSADTLCGYLNRFSPKSLTFTSDCVDSSGERSYLLNGATEDLRWHRLFSFTSRHGLYFWNGGEDNLPLPGWATHYLLLYLLGILCRYETEWWGELVLSHTLAEQILIQRFLHIHQEQFPALICHLLQTISPHGFFSS